VNLSALFSPARLANLDLPNRFVMAPMTRQKSLAYTLGRGVAAYYRRRAENGVGLLLTEGTTIDHDAASPDSSIPAFHGDALKGWERVVSEVHAAGGRIMPQLWRLGIARYAAASPRPETPLTAPSSPTQILSV
jgi:2,4-dienoyl-CoA reductase-like NADH-dependent reductase (Old Yellow Enzyme family)